ncbi:MAG: hypothetical protein J6M55_06740 [Paludibacteraceae bacterium]|nr:hypothetical protein [Paludibacteraceae bacterium]
MKRSLFVLAVVLCSLMAQAADYPYLVFTNTGGTSTVMDVSDLTLAVSGSSLQVTNTAGTTSFTLTNLANMQFSKDGSTVSAIENVIDAGVAVELFSMTGVSLGHFNTLLEAVSVTGAGAYVVKQGNNTQTIVIK